MRLLRVHNYSGGASGAESYELCTWGGMSGLVNFSYCHHIIFGTQNLSVKSREDLEPSVPLDQVRSDALAANKERQRFVVGIFRNFWRV